MKKTRRRAGKDVPPRDTTELLLSIHATMVSVVDAVHQLKDRFASLEKEFARHCGDRRGASRKKSAA
jgi:hypothetical protein